MPGTLRLASRLASFLYYIRISVLLQFPQPHPASPLPRDMLWAWRPALKPASIPLTPSRPALRPSSALERCLEAWLQPCFVLINKSLRGKPVEKSRPRLVGFHPCVPCLSWWSCIDIASCHLHLHLFHLRFFWWSCVAPALHHLHFRSFCFSSAPEEKTTQSAEIGGQTEHPRPLLALLAFKRTRQQ